MNNEIDKNDMPTVTEAKNWPGDNKRAIWADIVDPLREAMQVIIDKGDQVYEDGIEWNGLKQGMPQNVNHPPYELHSETLKYNKKRDRDAITSLLQIAVQLAMEQGRREIKEQLSELRFVLESNPTKDLLDIMLKDKNG